MSEPAMTPQSSRIWDKFILVAVSLALLIVLWSLFAPAIHYPGHVSPTMRSHHNLHLIGIGITNYATGNVGMLPPTDGATIGHSWRMELYPFLERGYLAREYRKEFAWDSPENKSITSQWWPVMTSGHRPRPCKDAKGRGYADFGLITGSGTANPSGGLVTLDFIFEHDGLGQTLLVGECSGLQLIWTEPRDPDVAREQIGMTRVTSSRPAANHLLSSYSSQGVCTLFADGAAKFLSYDIDPTVLKSLTTTNGGEKIGDGGCR